MWKEAQGGNGQGQDWESQAWQDQAWQDTEFDQRPDGEMSYRALRRAIDRGVGFGLLFVRCTPVIATEIIGRLGRDLPQKRVATLVLDGEMENFYGSSQQSKIPSFYQRVVALRQQQAFEVLFVRGMEYPLLEHERQQGGDMLERSRNKGYGGREWETVPRILGHLNLSRERFRDDFPVMFVLFLPEFALNYFIRRAPDFFDWRSGMYEFWTDPMQVMWATTRLTVLAPSYEEYCRQTPAQRLTRLVEIHSYVAENPSVEQAASLWFERGLIDASGQHYEQMLAAYDKVLEIKPHTDEVWNNRGIALGHLGRYEEEIAAYDKALTIKPDKDEAWYNRGIALRNLGRYEEAINSYNKALKIKPNYYQAWYNKGIALDALAYYEEALVAYDTTLEINPDYYQAWYNRGIVLRNLGRYGEAVSSYNKALKIKPDNHQAWYNRGNVLSHLGYYEEAVSSYDKALKIKPDKNIAWYVRGCVLGHLGSYEEAIDSYDKALEIKPNDNTAWQKRGNMLLKSGKFPEAKESLEHALKLNPTDVDTLATMAYYFVLQNDPQQALTYLAQAVEQDNHRRGAIATDPDFASLHPNPHFQTLINNP
jgi:tetratricopeptide (TPR) repeat protein